MPRQNDKKHITSPLFIPPNTGTRLQITLVLKWNSIQIVQYNDILLIVLVAGTKQPNTKIHIQNSYLNASIQFSPHVYYYINKTETTLSVPSISIKIHIPSHALSSYFFIPISGLSNQCTVATLNL